MEDALHSAEGQSVEQVVRRIVEPLGQGPQQSPEAEGEAQAEAQAEAAQFVHLLEQRFDFRKLEREKPGRRAGGREAARLLSLRKLDLPLYAVYRSCKRAVAERR
ncbi:MAG: hypothetical protein A2064_03110 [Spirochaetes bacterium GWB1_66_5]|nr:MAG: hypothetical protein A2064_03110 [Spirochaetes bacterium GWB1_66_5]